MQQTQPAYRPDIDGLRAVAVVSVLLFHAGLTSVGGGYLGVDVFFVISGFVIALSLKRDLVAGQFSLAAFYERRIRRILPALTVVLLATATVSLWIAPPFFYESFAKSVTATAVFLSNMHFWADSDYFNSDLRFRPLLHTWSLGVEEQYYLLAPVFLYLVFRYLKQRWLLAILPLLVASFALNAFALVTGHYRHAFYLLPMRGWEFLFGVLLALAPPPTIKSRIFAEGISVTGLALIVASVMAIGPMTPHPELTMLAPCLGAALLIYAGSARSTPFVRRFLAWRPVVFTGRISYSLYLVHWPIFVLTDFALARRMEPLEAGLALAASFAAASLLYAFVEQPARRAPARRLFVFVLGAVAIGATVCAGLVGPALNRQIFSDRADVNYQPDASAFERSVGWGKCLLTDGQSAQDWRLDACRLTDGDGGDILLFGDSFAAHYAPGIRAQASRISGRVIQYSWAGCPPILAPRPAILGRPECQAFMRNVTRLVADEGIRRVVVSANWLEYGDDLSLQVGGTIEALKALGAEVTLIGQSPNFYIDPVIILAKQNRAAETDASLGIGGEAARMNDKLRAIAQKAGVRFIDPTASLCREDLCPVRVGGQNLFYDYGHFTEAGSSRAVAAYFPYITR
jgi:peptidoglycan/LPS O-acetylase OafA/YrhL